MTVTDIEVTEDTDTDESTSGPGRPKERDFTKFRPLHEDLANYINANSGLPPVSPNQVKAVIMLRSDYANTDEAKAQREIRKAEREAEKQKYAGMSEEQIKAAKAAKRAEAQHEKLLKQAEEAMERARSLERAASGSGEDLAAFVESTTKDKPKLGRGRPKKATVSA